MDEEGISLISLKEGAAVELFDAELQKVLDNIMDPNTKPDSVREVILKVKFKPEKDRSMGIISIEPFSRLAPQAPVATRVFLGGKNGKGVAFEHNPKQPSLPFGQQDEKSARPIKVIKKEV